MGWELLDTFIISLSQWPSEPAVSIIPVFLVEETEAQQGWAKSQRPHASR